MRRVCAWLLKLAVVSVALQLIILSYFNFIYLQRDSSVKATLYVPDEPLLSDRSMTIASNAKNIKISSDGMLAGYLTEGRLVIEDLTGNSTKRIIDAGENSICFFSWLPDRRMVIYAFEAGGGNSVNVNIKTFDVEADVERSYPAIEGLPQGSRLIDIQLSPLINNIYIKIDAKEMKTRLYKFDIMDNQSYIMGMDLNSKFRQMLYSDIFIYEEDLKLFARYGETGTVKQLPVDGKAVLLEMDIEDRVYAGHLNDEGKVEEVSCWTMEKEYEWSSKRIGLEHAVEPENIVILPSGEVFILDDAEKSLYRASDRLKIQYEGEFVSIHEKGIFSRKGKRLYFTACNTSRNELLNKKMNN